MQMLSVKNLDYAFGEGEAQKQVLFDIKLDILPGQLTMLMGPSGSGKTTLLTLMACLRNVQTGSIELLGQELNGIDDRQKCIVRRELGFIFQAHNLHKSLTAFQNVAMGLEVFNHLDHSKKDQAVKHVLDLVGLSNRLDHLPSQLSGGQNQRVAIARALVGNPKIIFADEPTAALDKESGMKVVNLLKRLARSRNTASLMVTHDNRVLEHADRILVMEDGKIVDDRKQ